MAFEVGADAYGRFMGRYSEPLADLFLDWAGVEAGQRVLDVGCGPGAVTERLVRAGAVVSAVDPSDSFVTAARQRCPGVAIQVGVAEQLPFADGSFDTALAQLVVHFMRDPVAGFREMGRVSTGTVAASVWDFGGGTGPVSTFWAAVQDLEPGHPGEEHWAGTREGHLAELAAAAGLREIESGALTVTVAYGSFEEWWEPYTLGVGPAGDYVTGLDAAQTTALKARCAVRLPEAPFEINATAWAVKARA